MAEIALGQIRRRCSAGGRRGDVLIAQAVGRAAIKPDTINDDLIDAGRIISRIEILPTR